MLRPCRINPQLSTDAFLEGQHDYNAVPFPPLGWRMLMLKGPGQGPSWGVHEVEGCSIGPAEGNYRCYKGWVPATGSERISDTVVFFPPRKLLCPIFFLNPSLGPIPCSTYSYHLLGRCCSPPLHVLPRRGVGRGLQTLAFAIPAGGMAPRCNHDNLFV